MLNFGSEDLEMELDFSMRNFSVDIDSERRLKLLNLISAKLGQRIEVAKQ
jgi:hypothetical protein